MSERRAGLARSWSGAGAPAMERGASLIEILVALGLIAIVLLPMLATLATSGIVAERFARSGEDLILARSQLESILRQQYQPAAGTATPYATIAPFSGLGVTHAVATVVPYSYPTPVSPTATVAPPPETVQTITITVDFPTGSYQLSTIKTNRKLR